MRLAGSEPAAATDTPQAIRGLIAAYRAARYRVRLAEGEVVLRVGSAPPTALQRLLQHDRPWVLISACNPHSRPCPARSNAVHMRALTRVLAALAPLHVLTAAGSAPDRSWVEPGLLVIDLASDVTDALARRFGQNALLVGRGATPARLRLYRADWAAALDRVDSAGIEWAQSAVEFPRA